jgi:hypothetical protein
MDLKFSRNINFSLRTKNLNFFADSHLWIINIFSCKNNMFYQSFLFLNIFHFMCYYVCLKHIRDKLWNSIWKKKTTTLVNEMKYYTTQYRFRDNYFFLVPWNTLKMLMDKSVKIEKYSVS